MNTHTNMIISLLKLCFVYSSTGGKLISQGLNEILSQQKKSETLLCKHAIRFFMRPLLKGFKHVNNPTLFCELNYVIFRMKGKGNI